MVGSLRIESAEIMDIPTSKITWRLYLPERYSYLYMKGSLDPRRRTFPALRAVNSSILSRKVYPQSRIAIDQERLPQQDDEEALYGLDLDLVREGRLYVLSKLDKDAFLHIHYMEKGILFKISLALVALVTIIFTYVPHRMKSSKIMLFFLFGIAALFLRGFLPQGFRYFASLLLLGLGLSAVVLLCLYLRTSVQSRRAARKHDG
jgi:hypothetical protein